MHEVKQYKTRGSRDVSYLGKTVDQLIWEVMDEKDIPGLTLAIVQAPYIPRIVGYGFSDIEQQRLASTQTMWPIGPISQAFTAVAIMQLYEANQLNITDVISIYLENIPTSWKNITLLQLLRHSTGIADYRLQPGFDVTKAYSAVELITTVQDIPLAFEPDTEVVQSATNFLLLAEVIEKVSGKSYHDFVTENQIKALNLRHTGFSEDLHSFFQEDVSNTGNVHQLFKQDKHFIDPSESAVGYNTEMHKVPPICSAALKGFADIWSSAGDVSFWDIGLAGSILVKKPENRALLYSPFTLKNGNIFPAVAGWQFYSHKGLMEIKGGVPGFSSFLSRFTDPSELVCVTLLCNKEGIDFTNLGRKIAGAFSDMLATGYDDNQMYLYECQFDVPQTVAKLEALLKTHNIPVFAIFDHSQNAKSFGLELRPTQVVVFGNPAVGTKLMQENQSIALELPLKIAVWEDAKGSVWLGIPCMKHMAQNYGLENHPIIFTIHDLLETMASKVSNAYQ